MTNTVTLTLTEDEYKFLKDLAHELRTQNNRVTSDPYFYTVRQTKRVVGMMPEHCAETVYVDVGGGDYEEYADEDKAIEGLVRDGMSLKEAQAYFDKEFEEYGVHTYEYNTNVFLTYKGYIEHMRLNGHNYSRAIDSDKYTAEKDGNHGVYSYVDYAARNPEMAQLIKILKKIGE